MAIVADLGTLHRIARKCSRSMASYMALTGAKVTAQEALRSGIVSHVWKDERTLRQAALAAAREMASNSPLVVQGTKRVLNYSAEHSPADALEYVAMWNQAFLRSDDLGEAVGAFFEKRKSQFKCRL